MRVLYTNHTAVVSGAELCLLDLLRALPDTIEPLLACPQGDLADRARSIGVRVVDIRGTEASLRLGPQAVLAVGDIARSGLAVARIARGFRADLIHANSLRCGLMSCVAGRVPGVPPTLAHLHDCLPEGRASTAVRRTLRIGVEGFTANSRYTAESFAPGDPAISVTYNPLDLERFDTRALTTAGARAALDLPQGVPLLGVVAQITPWKGQVDVVRALPAIRQAVPDARLVLAGSAKFVSAGTRFDNRSYLRMLESEVARLGLEQAVHFIGERSDVPALLRGLDVLVMASWEEPFGRIAAEAMAMGTATVATSVGGPPEFIVDGRTGVLVAPRDPAAVADAVIDLLQDRAKRERIARDGRSAARARFSLGAYARDLTDVYARMLPPAGRRPPRRPSAPT